MKMEGQILAGKVKELRKRKAWSQSHLAEAAGLSTRTIQRLERTGNCSYETLLSVAAVFDVDIEELTDCSESKELNRHKVLSNRRQISSKTPFWEAFLLMLPGLLFVTCNVLKYELDIPWLYDFFVSVGEITGFIQFVNFFTNPVLLIGGLCLSVVIGLIALIDIKGETSEEGFRFTGIHFSFDTPLSIVLVFSLSAIIILIGYATVENLVDWIAVISGK